MPDFRNRSYVECKCPMCEKKHKTKSLYWTGNGVPRIYCDPCRQIVRYGEFALYKWNRRQYGVT